MKKTFYILIFISFARQFFGQTNLLINPSFESYTACPSNQGDIYKAVAWDFCNNTSPDYFNSCDTYSGVSTPGNDFGYKW